MTRTTLFLAVLMAAALSLAVPERAAAHGDGSWMLAAEAAAVRTAATSSPSVGAAGRFDCRFRSPIRSGMVPPLECFVNIAAAASSASTPPGKRIAYVPAAAGAREPL